MGHEWWVTVIMASHGIPKSTTLDSNILSRGVLVSDGAEGAARRGAEQALLRVQVELLVPVRGARKIESNGVKEGCWVGNSVGPTENKNIVYITYQLAL